MHYINKLQLLHFHYKHLCGIPNFQQKKIYLYQKLLVYMLQVFSLSSLSKKLRPVHFMGHIFILSTKLF